MAYESDHLELSTPLPTRSGIRSIRAYVAGMDQSADSNG